MRRLFARKCRMLFQPDFRIPEKSAGSLAPVSTSNRSPMGLERTAHNIVCTGLAANFSASANRSHHAQSGSRGIEHPRARTKVSSWRRSANWEDRRSRLQYSPRSNLPRCRATVCRTRQLSRSRVRGHSGKCKQNAGPNRAFLRSAIYSKTIGERRIDDSPWRRRSGIYLTWAASSQRIAARSNSPNEFTPNFSFARAQ